MYSIVIVFAVIYMTYDYVIFKALKEISFTIYLCSHDWNLLSSFLYKNCLDSYTFYLKSLGSNQQKLEAYQIIPITH